MKQKEIMCKMSNPLNIFGFAIKDIKMCTHTRTLKLQAIFFKMQSISILAIRYNREQ